MQALYWRQTDFITKQSTESLIYLYFSFAYVCYW